MSSPTDNEKFNQKQESDHIDDLELEIDQSKKVEERKIILEGETPKPKKKLFESRKSIDEEVHTYNAEPEYFSTENLNENKIKSSEKVESHLQHK